MKKQPLVAVVLLFAAGMVVTERFPLDWRILLGASIVLLIFAIALPVYRAFLLVPLLFLAGATDLSTRTATISPHDLRIVFGNDPQIVTLRGHLTETPYQRVYERRGQETFRTVAFLSVDTVSFRDRTNIAATGDIAISTPGTLPSSFCSGQSVEINGVLEPPRGALAEGLFDYRQYLKRLGIYHQLQVASTNDWRLAGRVRTRPLADRFLDWAQSALALGLPRIDEPVRLLWAMTLGWKTAFTGEVSEPFMRSGTMHVFAKTVYNSPNTCLSIQGEVDCIFLYQMEFRAANTRGLPGSAT